MPNRPNRGPAPLLLPLLPEGGSTIRIDLDRSPWRYDRMGNPVDLSGCAFRLGGPVVTDPKVRFR